MTKQEIIDFVGSKITDNGQKQITAARLRDAFGAVIDELGGDAARLGGQTKEEIVGEPRNLLPGAEGAYEWTSVLWADWTITPDGSLISTKANPYLYSFPIYLKSGNYTLSFEATNIGTGDTWVDVSSQNASEWGDAVTLPIVNGKNVVAFNIPPGNFYTNIEIMLGLNDPGSHMLRNFRLVSDSAAPTIRELENRFVDATSLEEQIVPGEFWLDVNGVVKQVYQRTFVGTITSNATILTTFAVAGFSVVSCAIKTNVPEVVGIGYIDALNSTAQWTSYVRIYITSSSRLALVRDASSARIPNGAPYSITVKYIKS